MRPMGDRFSRHLDTYREVPTNRMTPTPRFFVDEIPRVPADVLAPILLRF